MTRTLLLRLAASQQSWGGPASHRWRPTEKLPTRSGITGLLAAALGVPRGEHESALEDLTFHVRVDRAGTVMEDFHTVTGPPADVAETRARTRMIGESATKVPRTDFVVPLMNGRVWLSSKKTVESLVTRRLYLADAEFILAVSGAPALVERVAAAAYRPVFPMYLGRAKCAPTFPFHLGTRDGDGVDVLTALPSTAGAGRALPVFRVEQYRATQVARIDVPRTLEPLKDWKP
ncbi:type I-E CRISPR-associated protein Cas5/CasD [Microbacterium sp. 77mftsu3.1]|uniref:type I-E CRISPR-associated protein Cas5/CasD n=1 Tax=Microbacterium sp. 77mftsu3.1 TaxID=1761802 RepID=UPI00037C2284|nr:type I-E CRISPR-associated protein Cas5/CasD [Microbacterium sp. 77mftsu3.1]SDH50228.1 CRISPR system Cascade subunit CasD [Microbacterium sp. 77mftsu3.1]